VTCKCCNGREIVRLNRVTTWLYKITGKSASGGLLFRYDRYGRLGNINNNGPCMFIKISAYEL